MLAGLVVLAGVLNRVLGQGAVPAATPPPWLGWAPLALLVIGVPISYFIRNQCYKRAWRGHRVDPSGYVTGNLAVFALLEIVVVAGLAIGLLSPGAGPAPAAALLAFGLFLLNFPPRSAAGRPPPGRGGTPRAGRRCGTLTPRNRACGFACGPRVSPARWPFCNSKALPLAWGRCCLRLTGREDWPVGPLRRTRFADIDSGLAGRVSEGVAQLMPHGGLRVLQRLEGWLTENGVPPVSGGEDRPGAYPEASDPHEAAVLHAIARAASPAAIDRLARQPALWRAVRARGAEPVVDPDRQRILQRLIDPPSVVVVGRPNAGKSTLLNRLTGRGSALVSAAPGTTRDWVGGAR